MTHVAKAGSKDSSTLDQNFWPKPLKSESGALNQKTCQKAGLGGRKPPSLAVFEGQSGGKVSAGGLEPSTNGLKGHCSAIELRAQRKRIVARGQTRVNKPAPNVNQT